VASRIVIHLEETCTPAQAGQFWNQLAVVLGARMRSASDQEPPEIEVIVPHGILDRQLDEELEAARDAVREKFAPPRPYVPPGVPVPGR
jgi:hypothetical protein